MVNAFSIAKFNVPPSLRTCNFDLWIKYQKILRLLGLDLPPEKIRGRPVGYYSDKLMEHFQAPRNNGPMANSDSIGLVGVPGQGPATVVYGGVQRCRPLRSLPTNMFQAIVVDVEISAGLIALKYGTLITNLSSGRACDPDGNAEGFRLGL